MDTSEQYIKMCEKADEIQKLKPIEPPFNKWEAGDFYTVDCPLGPCVSVHNDAGSYGLGLSTTWLPRQDQLQEMVAESYQPHWQNMNMLHDFYDWAINYICDARVLWSKTIEQLWLAFVMKEKYNKVWNGENWSNHAIL